MQARKRFWPSRSQECLLALTSNTRFFSRATDPDITENCARKKSIKVVTRHLWRYMYPTWYSSHRSHAFRFFNWKIHGILYLHHKPVDNILYKVAIKFNLIYLHFFNSSKERRPIQELLVQGDPWFFSESCFDLRKLKGSNNVWTSPILIKQLR